MPLARLWTFFNGGVPSEMIDDYYIDPSVNCALIRQKGEYKKAEGVAALYQLVGHPLYELGMNIYRDLSDCEFHPDYEYSYFKDEIRTELTRNLPKMLGQCKIGWLVNSVRDYSIVHQIGVSTRLTPSGIERKPFREKAKLISWLGLPLNCEIEFSKEHPVHQ
jgi:hypothetical protein